MKKLSLFISIFFIAICSCQAQEKWNGAWHGTIDVANLRIVFNIKTTETGATSVTMDSPDQSAFGLPVQSAEISKDSIFISDDRYRMRFAGERINDSVINGVFTQGVNIPLVLKRSSAQLVAKPVIKKQTPVPPFPYLAEEVTIRNEKAGVTLSGTLTIPSGTNGTAYPAVILVTGSGPQDRDESILGHKPFAVLADHLTRAGMLVLRYDDRGVGMSTGDFASSTTEDFASDASAVLRFLSERKEVDKKRIGIIGHSEGGMIAPMVANENKLTNFIIMLAGPGIPIKKLMAEQNVAIMHSQGVPLEVAKDYGSLYEKAIAVSASEKKMDDKTKVVEQIAIDWSKDKSPETLNGLGLQGDSWQKRFASALVEETAGNWMQYFLNYDPEDNLKKLRVKVLALNGDKDNQVLSSSNLAGIESVLKRSKSPSYHIVSLPGLNHLFQTCKLCTVAEYGLLEETFSTGALNEITSWLKKENILRK